MGINKRKLQMKFLALIAGAAAIKLHQKHAAHKTPAVHALLAARGCPTPEEEAAVAEWVHAELAKDGGITLAEIAEALHDHVDEAEAEDMWAEIEAGFDLVDADSNGEVTGPELRAAWEAHEEEYRKKCPA